MNATKNKQTAIHKKQSARNNLDQRSLMSNVDNITKLSNQDSCAPLTYIIKESLVTLTTTKQTF